MIASQIQQTLFQRLKEQLPAHVSLADEVASLLEISSDSAYRRIRGEKSISLEELQKICSRFRLSVDQVLNLQTDAFLFSGQLTNSSEYSFETWMQTDIKHLETILSFKQRHLYYLAKEIPFFYYFVVPEITAFKSFFFKKSILHYENLKGVKFSLNDNHDEVIALGRQICQYFTQIPSTEIWNVENLTSTIRQIEFYKLTGILRSESEVSHILNKLGELLDHIERQAAEGRKFMPGEPIAETAAPVNMYINELIMGDNLILAQLDNLYVTYINHSIINFITTRDPRFTAYTRQTLENITNKSTPVSGVNEKARIKFFSRIHDKINRARTELCH
jgi:plasmid maintenance system antidote protein VapI